MTTTPHIGGMTYEHCVRGVTDWMRSQ